MDDLLYVSPVRVRAAEKAEAHAIFGQVFEPELVAPPPVEVAPELGTGLVRVRALDQLVLALAG